MTRKKVDIIYVFQDEKTDDIFVTCVQIKV